MKSDREFSPHESNHEQQIEDDFYIAQEIHRNNYPQYSESRSEIQQQIAQLPAHEQFDISSFAESRNTTEVPIKNIREKFPFSNAPTLNLGQKKHKNQEQKIPQRNQEQYQGLTNPVISSLLKRISELEEQNESLRNKLQENDSEFEKFIKKLKQMNQEKIVLEQKILKKESIIKELENNMKASMKGYKQKYEELLEKLKTSRGVGVYKSGGSRVVGEYRVPEETELQMISLQLMSPEECVHLFMELTLKLEKSSKIHKKLGRDSKIREILSKILKTQ